MRTETVKIKANGRTAEITLNGLKVETHVLSYRLDQEVHGFPVLGLELLAPGMEYEGATVVEIPAELRAVLIALGWTAPDSSTVEPKAAPDVSWIKGTEIRER